MRRGRLRPAHWGVQGRGQGVLFRNAELDAALQPRPTKRAQERVCPSRTAEMEINTARRRVHFKLILTSKLNYEDLQQTEGTDKP